MQEDLYFADHHNKGIIKNGLPISVKGWQGSQIIQAMGVKLAESQDQVNEIKSQLKVTKKRLRRSLDTIHKLNNQDFDSSEYVIFLFGFILINFYNSYNSFF